MNYNKKWFISLYVYLVFLWVTIIIGSIISWTFLTNYYGLETIHKTKSYYASETGIEEGLLAFKKQPDIDKFIPNEATLEEQKNKRTTEYKEQKVYKKELVIKETILAWKSIQLPFRKKDIDSRITKFHIAVLSYDTQTTPTSQDFCNRPKHNSAVEITALQKATIINDNPLDYTVELNSNWNGCYIWNNSSGKTSLITYTDPYSNEKVSLVWDKCVMNSKWNITWAVFEDPIPYKYDDKWDSDPKNDTCEYNCAWTSCSKYYTIDSRVTKLIKWELKFYTIANNFIYDDMSDTWLIMFNIRAVDDDAEIALWATDDAGNAYEIPWRYVNFSALWISQGWDIKEGLFTRLKLKKKANNDLISIFDYSIFSNSEFIK